MAWNWNSKFRRRSAQPFAGGSVEGNKWQRVAKHLVAIPSLHPTRFFTRPTPMKHSPLAALLAFPGCVSSPSRALVELKALCASGDANACSLVPYRHLANDAEAEQNGAISVTPVLTGSMWRSISAPSTERVRQVQRDNHHVAASMKDTATQARDADQFRHCVRSTPEYASPSMCGIWRTGTYATLHRGRSTA